MALKSAVVFAASEELHRDLKWLENNDYGDGTDEDAEASRELTASQAAPTSSASFSELAEFAPLVTLLQNAGYSTSPATPRLPSRKKNVALVVVAGTSRLSADTGPSTPSDVIDPQKLLPLIALARQRHPTAFVVAWHPAAETDPFFREDAFFDGEKGCNMVSYDTAALATAATLVLSAGPRSGSSNGERLLECPWCNVQGFTEDTLWVHAPLYHVNSTNHTEVACPVCRVSCGAASSWSRGGPLPVHLRNCHGPCSRGEVEPERSTGLFAIVVCRRPSDNHFLLVQEFGQSGFWLPGGQLDAGESLRAAVQRECQEEAGVKVQLLGVLDVQVADRGRWRRVTFYAEPADPEDCRPKSLPDYESAGAVWAPLSAITGFSNGGKDDAKSRRDSGPPVYKAAGSPGSVRGRRVQLRGDEPIKYCPHVAFGGDILPLAIPEEYAAAFRDVPF